MAKKAEVDAEVKVKVGDKLTFGAYEDLPEGMKPIFKSGDNLIVKEVVGTEDDGQVKVKAYLESDKKQKTDTVFVPLEAELTVAAPAKAKGKKAVAEVEPEDEDAEGEVEDADDAEAEDVVEAPVAKRGKAVKAPAEKPAKAVAKAKPEVKAKGKALAVPARTAEEAEQAEIVHLPAVHKMLKKGDILDTAKELAEQSDKSGFYLGGILAEIARTKEYMEAGYEKEIKVKDKKTGKTKVVSAFEQYLNNELGIEYRSAKYKMDIYIQMSKVEGLNENRLASIGWTKVRLLAQALRASEDADIEELMDMAENSTREELADHIKTTLVGGASKGDKIKKVKYLMTAFGDEADYIGAAISRAQEMVPGGDANSAMKHIFREWALMQDGVEIAKEDAIKALEARYDIELVEAGEVAEAEVLEAPKPKAKAKAVAKASKPAPKLSVVKKGSKVVKSVKAKANGKRKAA